MSKRRRKSTNKFKANHPREIGKFYHIGDRKGGHPSLVYFSDSDKDIYYIQRFSTSKGRHREKLNHNIDPLSNENQWLIKRPESVGYDDLTYKDKYKNYRIHKDDMETVMKYRKEKIKKIKK